MAPADFKPISVDILTTGSRAGRLAILTKPYRVQVRAEVCGVQVGYVDIIKGFVTDFASVPRRLWSVVDPWGKPLLAAVTHDYLYWSGRYPRAVADGVFLLLMERLEVPLWRRRVMYRAVRMFGWAPWRKHRRGRYPHGEGGVKTPRVR